MDRIAILEAAVRKNDAMMNTAVRFLQAAVGSPISLATLDRDTLVCALAELGSRYKVADAERLELKRLIPDAQSSRIQLVDAIRKHKELEDAHMIQSKFIHQLQKRTSTVHKYIETIEIQEKVIMKMQKVIETSTPKRIRNLQIKIKSESDTNMNKINFDERDENTSTDNENQVEDLKKRISQLTDKVDYKNSKIEENLFVIEEKGTLLNKKIDENNALQEKNIELIEKYQELQNEYFEIKNKRNLDSKNSGRTGSSEIELRSKLEEMEKEMGRMAENRDTVEMKWKAAIEIIENMKNNHTEEEEARIRERERDIEAGRHLLKEEKKIAPDEERERMEAVQREIHMLDDDDQIMKQKRKEDFDKEILSKDSCILELASQLSSLKSQDELFKMEKMELENKLNLRISELEKEFIIESMKNGNLKLDRTNFNTMRNVIFNDQTDSDTEISDNADNNNKKDRNNEHIKKLLKYIKYEGKKHNDHISELISLLSVERKQKDDYRIQLDEYENSKIDNVNSPMRDRDSLGCTNITDITERSNIAENYNSTPSPDSHLTSFIKKDELEKLLLCSTADFETMKKSFINSYSNSNSIPKNSRSTVDLSARTEETDVSNGHTSFQMTAFMKINELENQLLNSENAKSMLEREIEDIMKKNYLNTSAVLENKAEEENLRNKINELEAAKLNKISELNTKFSIMENEFKTKIVDIDKEKTTKFDELKNQLSQFSSTGELLKNQIIELEISKDKKIIELEKELDTSKIELDDMTNNMNIMRNEILELKLQNENTENNNQNFNMIKNTKISDLETEILELEKHEKSYLNQIKDLEATRSSDIKEYENKEKDLINEFSETEKIKNSKIKDFEAQIIALKIQLEFCSNKIKNLEKAATETIPSNEVRSPKEYERHIDKIEAELAAKDFRISALETQLVNSAQESSRIMARLRTELFEMRIQGLGSMDDDYEDNISSTYGNQFNSPRDYIPSSQLLANNIDSDFSTPDSERYPAARRSSLQPNGLSNSPGNGVSIIRPPSGNAVKAANALRHSNTSLIELKASSNSIDSA